MYKLKYFIFTLLILSAVVLFFNGCKTLQRLPEEKTADAQIYIKRCGACHPIPHPSRLKFSQWKTKIVVLRDKQMPVIKEQEKEKVLSYIKDQSRKDLTIYNLRCGKCHIAPDTGNMNVEVWEDLIVVLDGDMPVFSEEERKSVVRYLQNFSK